MRTVVCVLSLPLDPESDRAVAWAIIEAQNLWASFLRAYYLSAAIRTRRESGSRINLTAAFPDIQAALKFAVLQMKDPKFTKSSVSRRDEPAWHDTRKYLTLLNTVGISNLAQVRAAFSYRTTFFYHLPTIRNFYAHRCDDTFRKAGNVGIRLGLAATPDLHATEIMCSRLPASPQNVATEWLDDITNIIELLCL